MKVGDIMWQAYVCDHDYGEGHPDTSDKITIECDRYQITSIHKGDISTEKKVFIHLLCSENFVKGKLIVSQSKDWMKYRYTVTKKQSIYQGWNSYSKTRVAALRHALALERKEDTLTKKQMKKLVSVVKRAITMSKKK